MSTVQSLSGKFLSLLRDHSSLKRESSRRCQASVTREDCHRNFWRYTKGLLDGNTTSQTSPNISASAAHSYFSEVYECSPHHFETPSWMSSPTPPVPDCSMDMSPITPEELSRVIKKSRSSSALDRISYLVLKRCFSLHPALRHLFNRVIMEGTVPSAWKLAAVKGGCQGGSISTRKFPSNCTHSINQQVALGNPEGEMAETTACQQVPKPQSAESFPTYHPWSHGASG